MLSSPLFSNAEAPISTKPFGSVTNLRPLQSWKAPSQIFFSRCHSGYGAGKTDGAPVSFPAIALTFPPFPNATRLSLSQAQNASAPISLTLPGISTL